MSSLYIVPTPIGNLEDMTLRAIRILKEADVIFSEDTRTTGHLLKHFEINTKLIAYHKFNEHKSLERYINIINSSTSAALVSDAGTPAISDPGFLLIRECIKNEINVDCLPGATALIPALVVSGLPNDRFCFEGFLPHKKGRQKKLLALKEETRTIVMYESCHRIVKLINELHEHFGATRQVVICRELSKLHEEIIRGTLEELIIKLETTTLKGEFVVVIDGYSDK